ncbi:TCAD7 domain-containing protein [Variovorax sp. CF079]|uniref:TCAD7 domain-containing protein n=1 Tax=Variovorax sp. CF079 TaxID=1882774 RepID=UPI00148117C3|nr:TCAD7 domain-containing protein [Variovorax sp. CF079]
MTASEVLKRLALNGFWVDATQPDARARLERVSAASNRPLDAVARSLARDAHRFGAAIRRQWGTHVLWYARALQEVLERCAAAQASELLVDVLALHEPDSRPPVEWADSGILLSNSVVMDKGQPMAVSLDDDSWLPAARPGSPQAAELATRSGPVGAAPAEPPAPVQAWPRIEAPSCQPAAQPFDVIVGFGAAQQAGLIGGPVALPFEPGVEALDLRIELSTGTGVEALEGWSRDLRVSVNDVSAAEVSFRLRGTEPTNRERAWLTMLEVRYLLAGTVCGTAARPLVILPAAGPNQPAGPGFGTAWQDMPVTATPVTLTADALAPDLTIEITKPDRNASSGHYVCQLSSPHELATERGPFPMDLGQNAKTFAKSLVEDVRQYSGGALVQSALKSIGLLVAERLPPQAFDALSELGAKLAPDAVPAVLITSAEPYVPWELAWMETPLDAKRPSYLGAQVLLGRWLRDNDMPPSGAARKVVVPRPATHPLSTLNVSNMAVMAAWYKAETGLRKLPKAEDEAKLLATTYRGVPLAARAEALTQLLNATLMRDFDAIQVQAVHFAGHGDFDPNRPDGSALFLEDGTPLRSLLFRSANYGGERQPLLFLNACMLGIGGELLGDMAGFPGHSLRGGFGGVLGALWEVDDAIAHDVALEFWQRALPPSPARGEPIGAILRELRARYAGDAMSSPVPTYLAYVYYGHPRLTLQRVP